MPIPLRHPYKHAMSEDEWKLFFNQLKTQLDPRCYVRRKPVSYGYRINVSVGARPSDITQPEWDELTAQVASVIRESIPAAEIEIRPWHDRFIFRLSWEAYIQTREP